MRRMITLAAAGVFGTAVLALADATPVTAPSGPAATNGMSSPYWNGNGTPQASDLPATDIRAVPVAAANAVKTRWSFYQNLDDLDGAIRVMRMRLDAQPEYVRAVADEKAAYAAAEVARVKALAPLNDNPAYTGAEKLRANLSTQIADEHDSPKPDETRLAAMAKLRLQYVHDNRQLEASLLERDDAYQDARRKSLDASQRVADLRKAQAYVFATDDTLAGLRKQVADARIEKLTATEYYESLIFARAYAIDYASFYRGVDVYHGYGNNDGYGIGGFGYGGGYGIGYGTGFGGTGLGIGGVRNVGFSGAAVR